MACTSRPVRLAVALCACGGTHHFTSPARDTHLCMPGTMQVCAFEHTRLLHSVQHTSMGCYTLHATWS
jgi:hypothetical protein